MFNLVLVYFDKKPRHSVTVQPTRTLLWFTERRVGSGWLVGWLVVFYVPSTARSFSDGTPTYCPLRRTWSSVFTPFPRRTNPGPSLGSPLHYHCATPASWKAEAMNINQNAVSRMVVMVIAGTRHEFHRTHFITIISWGVTIGSYFWVR